MFIAKYQPGRFYLGQGNSHNLWGNYTPGSHTILRVIKGFPSDQDRWFTGSELTGMAGWNVYLVLDMEEWK